MHPKPEDSELTPLESSLGALAPSRSLIDRDRLMYEAGRRSALKGRRREWAWPAVAAALAILSVGQFLSAGRSPAGRLAQRSVPTPLATPEIPPTAEPVVILTRRPPAARPNLADEALMRPRPLRSLGPETFPDPTLLVAAARLGELPQNSRHPLKASDGLDHESLSKIGGPL